MEAQQIERLVDAAVAELGSAAAASTVEALALEAAGNWPGRGIAGGAVGLEAILSVPPQQGPFGKDALAHAWDWVNRALSALPDDVPCLPVLLSFNRLADAMTESQVLDLAIALDASVQASGLPALRVCWADALSGSRGSAIVLRLLPDLVSRTSRLCGDIRCGDGLGGINRDALARVVEAASRTPRAPLGLFAGASVGLSGFGLVLNPVGHFPTAQTRVAARAWAARSACSARRRSGLDVQPGAPREHFDAPPASIGTLATTDALLALEDGTRRVWL